MESFCQQFLKPLGSNTLVFTVLFLDGVRRFMLSRFILPLTGQTRARKWQNVPILSVYVYARVTEGAKFHTVCLPLLPTKRMVLGERVMWPITFPCHYSVSVIWYCTMLIFRQHYYLHKECFQRLPAWPYLGIRLRLQWGFHFQRSLSLGSWLRQRSEKSHLLQLPQQRFHCR